MTKLLHFYPTLHVLGGVERMLHWHLKRDAQHGLDSVVVIPFRERAAATDPARVIRLGLSGWDNLWTLRRRFAAAAGRFKPEVIVYHNLWGARWLADVDGAARRIGQLHTDSDISRAAVRRSAGLVDGLLGVSETIATQLRAAFGDLPDGDARVQCLRYPAEVEGSCTRARSWPVNAPLVLGYCGRLVREQKRVDRLPSLLAALRAAGVPFVFQILGEGAEERWLRDACAGCPEVQFLGRKAGAEYGEVLAQWDAIVNCSDYEGTPISLLEALSCGVLPIYPRIGSGGEAYVEAIDPAMLYDATEPSDFVRAVRLLVRKDAAQIEAARARAREAVRAHSAANYLDTFASFCREIVAQPPARHPRPAPRASKYVAVLPFGLAGRMDPGFIY